MPDGKQGKTMDHSQVLQAAINAFTAGTARVACPYPVGSDEREVWFDGWDEAENLINDDELKDNV